MVLFIISLIGVPSVCAALGASFDMTLNDNKKRRIGTRVTLDIRQRRHTSVLRLILMLFRHAFKPAAMHRPCFWRSAKYSTLAVMLLLLFRFAGDWSRAQDLLDEVMADAGLLLLIYFVFAIVINWFADFLSLWETHLVLRRMALTTTKMRLALWLIVDVAATAVIVYTAFVVAIEIVGFVIDPDAHLELGILGQVDMVRVFLGFMGDALRFRGTDPTLDPLGIIIYTSLLPSAWVWVVISGAFVWSSMRPFLAVMDNLHKRPVLCIMTAGGVVLAGVLCLGQVLLWRAQAGSG